MKWIKVRPKLATEARPYVDGEPLTDVSMGQPPKPGDWIFRDARNHNDQWLVSGEYFEENYEPIPDPT